ncbi:MAG: filamentous hemagglutinin N-terminal domain-containing protein [Rhodospirillales bacterium]|nr:filamentous hemagglutinin N-terminal domain-containing protein [Rhodospirillales bacterium]
MGIVHLRPVNRAEASSRTLDRVAVLPRAWRAALLASTALAGAGMLNGPLAFANPTSGQVVGGSATITQVPGTTTIDQGSKRTIIDWRSFSIDGHETTRFNQPGRDAIALNRVRGGEASNIQGQLPANGNVWLINPDGVLIGPKARVDVGGFVATTRDILNEDFMVGRYRFSIPSPNGEAKVVNEGTISIAEGGLAGLVAPHVRNGGVIQGTLAEVVVAGVPTFALDFRGDGLIGFEATSAVTNVADRSEPLVVNTGMISADGGDVLLTANAADGVVDRAINMTGVVQARTVADRGGTIVLDGGGNGVVAVAGILDAAGYGAGEHGGSVDVLGERVALLAGSGIDASGDAGGGEVLVGGNYQGKGPERNATLTYVDKDARIAADAKRTGNGGKVIIWSDRTTMANGTISARGGATGGNGGFVEVSGKSNLAFNGAVDVGAAFGLTGTVLFDPANIIIATTSPGEDYLDAENFLPAILFGAEGDDGETNFWITPLQLASIDGNIVLQATDAIQVNSPLTLTNLTTGETFSLQAGGTITINGGITTAGGNLHFEADSPHTPGVGADGVGVVALNALVSTNGGAVTLIGDNVTLTLPIVVQAGSGAINLMRSRNGIDSPISIINALKTSGPFTIGRAVTRGDDGQGTNARTLSIGSLTVNLADPIAADTAGQLIFIALNDITFAQPLSASQRVTAQAGNSITVNASITTSGQDLHLEADSIYSPSGNGGDGTGAVVVNAPINTNGGNLTVFFGSSDQVGIDINALVQTGSGNINAAPSGPAAQDGKDFVIDDAESFANLRSTGVLTLGEALTRGPLGDGQNPQLTRAGYVRFAEPIVIPAEAARKVVVASEQDIDIDANLTVNQPLTMIADADGLPNDTAPGSEHWGWIVTDENVTLALNDDLRLTAYEGVSLTTRNLQRLAALVTGQSSYMPGNIAIRNSDSDITVTTVDGVSGVTSANSQVYIQNPGRRVTLDAPIVGHAPAAAQYSSSAYVPVGGDTTSSIILDSGSFSNNAGPAGLQPNNGRFLVYTTEPSSRSGLTGRFADGTYTSLPPGSPPLSPTTSYFIYPGAFDGQITDLIYPGAFDGQITDLVTPNTLNPVIPATNPAAAEATTQQAESVGLFTFAAPVLPGMGGAEDEESQMYSTDGNQGLWGLLPPASAPVGR